MKKTLVGAFILISCHAFSQNSVEYANFIQTDTAIKWAALYNSIVNLTPVNPNFNLSNYYFSNIKKSSLLNYKPNNTNFSVSPTPFSYKDMLSGLQFEKYDQDKMNTNFYFDINFVDGAETILFNEANECDTCLNNKLSLIKIRQLLYYKNNQFKIRNILINPIVYKRKAQTAIEETEFSETINVAFDEVNSDNSTIPANATFIGRACNLLNLGLNNSSENKILTLKNWSLCYLLYKDLKAHKLKAYDTDSSNYPQKNSILKDIDNYHNQPVEVTMYDSLGEINGTRLIMPEVNYDSFYNFKIIQDFYFDFTNVKMYSKLIALIPQHELVTQSGIALGLAAHWGVIFPEEKKKKAVVRKK